MVNFIYDGVVKVKLANFDQLSSKIEDIVKLYDVAKRDKEKVEAQMLRKDKESQIIKKKLEKALQERNIIKQRLDGISDKIDSLDLL